MVVAADEQLHRFLPLAAGSGLASCAAAGGLELTHRHPLEVAGLREQHDGALVGNQIDVLKPATEIEDFSAPRRLVAIAQLSQFGLDKTEHPFPAPEDVLVVRDLGDKVLVLQTDLVGLQRREPAQLHLQDGVRLDLGEAVAILQLLAGHGCVGCRPDQRDDRIQLIEGQQQTQQDVIPFLGLAKQIAGAAFNRLDPEVEKHLKHLAEREQDRLTVHQRQHVSAEVALQRRQLEQIVQHHLGIGVAAQFHNDAHAIAIALITDVGDALQLLVVDQVSDALDQRRLVGLVGQLGDDHRIPIRTSGGLDCLDAGDTAHGDGTATAQIGLPDPLAAEDLTAGGEVRSRNQLDQFLISDLRVLDQRQQAGDQFIEIVRRDVGGHSHRDARGTVEKQLGNPRRQHRRLLLRAIEVVREVNGLGLDVLQQADCRRDSVYRIAAGGSLSTEPKLPCPSIRGIDIEKSWAMRTRAS